MGIINASFPIQVASGIEAFKMESPVKKLDFNAGKENAPFDADVDTLANEIESQKPTEKPTESKAVAPTIKSEEADEPLLQENPHRFVLFPIKYHEVS